MKRLGGLCVPTARAVLIVIGISMTLPACESEGAGRDQHACSIDQVLAAEDAPCLCQGAIVDATQIGDECYCRNAGFECFDPGDCEELEVWDATGLWDALPGFGISGPYTTGALPISVDLVAATPLEVHADLFCPDPLTCDPVRFLQGESVPGITLEEPDEVYGMGWYAILRAEAGARFRIRPLQYDIHPRPPNFAPVLELEAPCDRLCGQSTGRCPEDRVCYSAGSYYCRGCTDLGVAVCVCQTADGPKPDGTECNYFISGDLVVSGECRRGVCESEYY